MKVCAKYKQRIAWMASGVLAANDSEAVRRHLDCCPACRRYWDEILSLTGQLVAASELPPAPVTAEFHQKLVKKIAAAERQHVSYWIIGARWLWEQTRVVRWIGGFAVAFAVVLWTQRLNTLQKPSSSLVAAHFEPASTPVQPNTFGSYRQAADRSLDELDTLLSAQANRALSSGESSTVSSLLAQLIEN
jgi:anti-sigma factor RsiW